MREQLPLMSLAIAAMAFLIALYPPGTFWGHRNRETRSFSSNSQKPVNIRNSGGNTSGTELVQLQEEVHNLSRKMDRLSQDYQALSEWTMEQLVAIEASKNSGQWDNEADTYQENSYPMSTGSDSRYVENANDHTEPARVFHDSSPSSINTGRVWPQNQFQSTIGALNLFPQQVEPARKVFDDAISESQEKIRELKSQGIISSESLAQIRNEVRATMEEKLSSILTSDQMDGFIALNSRTNRYENSKSGTEDAYVTGSGGTNRVSVQGADIDAASAKQPQNPSQTINSSTGETVSTTK